MNFFKRRKILSNQNFLEMVPVQKRAYEIQEAGRVALLIPKFRNEAFADLLVPKNKSRYITIRLDEMGSATWQLIDAQKNVQQICEELYNSQNQAFKDMEDTVNRVTRYLTMLYEQKYISFSVLER